MMGPPTGCPLKRASPRTCQAASRRRLRVPQDPRRPRRRRFRSRGAGHYRPPRRGLGDRIASGQEPREAPGRAPLSEPQRAAPSAWRCTRQPPGPRRAGARNCEPMTWAPPRPTRPGGGRPRATLRGANPGPPKLLLCRRAGGEIGRSSGLGRPDPRAAHLSGARALAVVTRRERGRALGGPTNSALEQIRSAYGVPDCSAFHWCDHGYPLTGLEHFRAETTWRPYPGGLLGGWRITRRRLLCFRAERAASRANLRCLVFWLDHFRVGSLESLDEPSER